jgi:hypothetical protein
MTAFSRRKGDYYPGADIAIAEAAVEGHVVEGGY